MTAEDMFLVSDNSIGSYCSPLQLSNLLRARTDTSASTDRYGLVEVLIWKCGQDEHRSQLQHATAVPLFNRWFPYFTPLPDFFGAEYTVLDIRDARRPIILSVFKAWFDFLSFFFFLQTNL